MRKISVLLLVSILMGLLCACSGVQTDTQTNISYEAQDTYGQVPTTADDIDYDTIVQIAPRESAVSFVAVGDNIIYNGQLREGLADGKNNDRNHKGRSIGLPT